MFLDIKVFLFCFEYLLVCFVCLFNNTGIRSWASHLLGKCISIKGHPYQGWGGGVSAVRSTVAPAEDMGLLPSTHNSSVRGVSCVTFHAKNG